MSNVTILQAMREIKSSSILYRVSLGALTLLCLSYCGRFGIESLDSLNTSSLGNASLSVSLGSNLKADMTAAGIDANSAQLIADNAVSLSSSLEASVQTSFSASAAQLSESSLYSSVSAKFTEGAMAGIKIAVNAGMSASLKATAAGINSYTPIRSMSSIGGLTESEKAAVSESISSTAVANMQSAGFSTAELSSALKEVTKKAVAAVAKSGVSATAMQTMVQKAAGGATKGLNTLATKAQSSGDSSFTVDIGSLAQDVAKGSVEGITEVTTVAGNDAAADLLSSVTSGLTAALVSIQEENPTFSASDALTSVTTAVTTQATSSLEGVISEEELNSTIATATSTVVIPTSSPVFSLSAQPIYYDTGIQVSLSSPTTGAAICYTTDGSSPSCISTKDACATGTLYDNKPLFFNSSTDLKAIACKADLPDSAISSALYPRVVPTYSATLDASPEYVVVAKAQTEAGSDASFEQIDLQAEGNMGLYLREDFDKDQTHANGEIMAWLRMKTGSYVIDNKKITVLKVALATLNEWQAVEFPTGYTSKAVILGNKISVANPSSKGSSHKRFSHLDIDYSYSGTTHTLKLREETDPSEANTDTGTEYASLIIMEEGVYRAGTGEVLWTAQNIQSTGSWTGLSHGITSSDLLGQVTSESSTAFMRLDVEETSTTNYNLKLEGDDTGGGNTAITATETVSILLMNKASLSLPEALANGNASWSSATLDSNEYMAVSAPTQIAWTTAAGDLSPTLYDCAVHASSVQPQIQLQGTSGSSYTLVSGPLPGSMTLSSSGLLSGYPVHETIGNVASYLFTAKISKYDIATQQLNMAERSFTLKVRHGDLGKVQECPVSSGYGLYVEVNAGRLNSADYPNGWYWVQRTTNYSTNLATRNNFGNMPSAVEMYVDMDRGGYDYYCFDGDGTSVSNVNTAHSGIAMGLDLVYPRSQSHWASMYSLAVSNDAKCPNGGNHMNYFKTAYAVYNVTNPNSGNQAMFSQNANNGGWRVPDGYQWYLKNTSVGEPNGNYTAYGLLQIDGFSNATISSGGVISIFDDSDAVPTGNYYFVSTNAKLE